MSVQYDGPRNQYGKEQLGHGQGMGPGGPGSPFQPLSPPPRRPRRPKSRLWILMSAIAVVLVLVMTFGTVFLVQQAHRSKLVSQVTPNPTSSTVAITTPAPTPSVIDNTPTPSPGVTQTPQSGLPVMDPTYWDTILGTQSGVNKVESVRLGNLMGNSSQQALVNVRFTGTDAMLDVYVFTTLTSKKPTQVFHLAGLVKGNTKISAYNTVMTAEVDKQSTLNVGKSSSAMTPDLSREFEWSAQENTFVQVAFPGIFPDMTRYQTEADQARVNQGQDAWKNDPARVAKALIVKFLGWKHQATTKVLSGGGARDVNATVQVQEVLTQGAQSQEPSLVVTLSRLEGNTHNFWVVTGVKDGTALTLTNLQPGSVISSPVKFEGKGNTFENTIGMAYVLDHLSAIVGQALVEGASGTGMGFLPYSVQVSYHTSFPQGLQEGIVEIRQTSPIGEGSAILVKVLLNP